MKKNFAYETYKTVEASSNYKNKAELNNYRKLLMDRVMAREIPFFKKLFPKGLGKTLEVGSGNSRILYALEQVGLLDSGLGIEISPSRVAFANAWKKELGSKVKTVVGDILDEAPKEQFDAVLCLTSIFPFFDMLEKNGLNKFLKTANELLPIGGTLILESETFEKEIAACNTFDGTIKLWDEFKPSDPFQFNLVTYNWNKKKQELTATSYNTKRHELLVDGPTTKQWHLESVPAVKSKLAKNGFGNVRLFADYDRSTYNSKSARYIFIAKKVK